jgi:glycosyltransferase involved in cell wall biosynthesis
VVIPAYNAAAFISQALDSVLRQTLDSIEVIVIDDGSADDTGAIVDGFVQRDPRVRLFRQENAGVGAARNTGIRHARGRYVAPIDADDIWLADKLKKQVARMEECGDEPGMVYCWSTLIDQAGRPQGVSSRPTTEGRVARALILRNLLGNASVPLFPAKVLSAVGGYLTRAEQGGAQGCEDWDLALRVAERQDVRVVAEPLVAYRLVHSSMSFRGEDMRRSYATMCDRLRSRNPDLSPSLLRWSAGRFNAYLASQAYEQGRYTSSILFTARAVMADTVELLNRYNQERVARCVVRLALGRRSAPPVASVAPLASAAALAPPATPPDPPRGNALYRHIQLRRWAAVQTPHPSPR